jgi:hypothetical protein
MKKYLATVATMTLPLAAAHAGPGLNGSYWAGGYGGNTGGTPTATFTTTAVCFPWCGGSTGDGDSLSNFLGVPYGYSSGLSTDFNGLSGHALQLTGFLNIGSAGVYNLGLYSDDGSYMYVDGNLVVNDGGDHGMNYVSNNIFLGAGAHSLLIYQEENGGGTGLSAYINGNTLGGDFLSTSAGVPEPASWALMLGGLGLVGAVMRNRRTSVRFA